MELIAVLLKNVGLLELFGFIGAIIFFAARLEENNKASKELLSSEINAAFMIQQPVVLRQGLFIAGTQLAQGIIQESPPGRCAGFQHQQILGTEQHCGQQTLKFGKALLLHAA